MPNSGRHTIPRHGHALRKRRPLGHCQLVQNPAPRGDGPCIYDDRLSRAPGGKVTLEPIADVPAEWDSPQEAFADTLAHEEKVTSMINALYAAAEAEHDYATRQMLNWYVAEQVEEEDSVHDILDSLKRIGTDATGLYQFDLELAKRVYTAPKAE